VSREEDGRGGEDIIVGGGSTSSEGWSVMGADPLVTTGVGLRPLSSVVSQSDVEVKLFTTLNC
jgi:hypothetical protein